jgi:NAD(P)-dependent dehydrogenase (short-subunit alcohol dehydrogenase family)
MSPRLTDRIAIVTGSSSGLDRAIGLAYAEEGAIVVCADIQPMTVKDARGEFLVTTQVESPAYQDRRSGGVANEELFLVAQTLKDFGRLDMYVIFRFLT